MKKINRREFIRMSAVLAAAGALTACGGSKSGSTAGSGAGASAEGVKGLTLKLSHNANEQHLIHKAMTQFANEVNEKTNGDIKIEVYPNATLGGEKENNRIGNENARKAAELERSAAETERAAAETERSRIFRGEVELPTASTPNDDPVDFAVESGWYFYKGGILVVSAALSGSAGSEYGTIEQAALLTDGTIIHRTCTVSAGAKNWSAWA